MKSKNIRLALGVLGITALVGAIAPITVFADTPENGWYEENGAKYWYENGVRQGYDEGNEAYRGKEIFDKGTNAWYWLDNVQKGAVAVNKDVYQESLAGPWGDYIGEDGKRYGKWVRYDANGHMIKGWSSNEDGTFYFDETYGTMAKGFATIEKKEYYFNKDTGVLEYEIGDVPEFGWKNIDGNDFWYEGYMRQGYSVNGSYRGKEIFDPGTNAWYWLDNVDGGKKATSKDVYQESEAGDWGDYVGADGARYGKWVRYDAQGHMIKGWSTNGNGTYYFDPIYGTMAKGEAVIGGRTYYFYPDTGILESNPYTCNLSTSDYYYKYEYAYKTGDMSVLAESDMAFYNGLAACLDAAYKGRTPYEKELAVHNYIIQNCEYDLERVYNGTEPWESHIAEGVFVYKISVCDGYAKAFKLCMDILGIPCIMVTGDTPSGPHAWNAVQLDGEWYQVDVTWDDPVPDRGPDWTRYEYFNVTDEKMREEHEYVCEVSCTATKYQYYEYLYRDSIENGDAYVAKIKEWAANAKAGDVIELEVKNREGDLHLFVDNYLKQLGSSDVIVNVVNENAGKLAKGVVQIFSIEKHTTLEEYHKQVKDWYDNSGLGDRLDFTIMFTNPKESEKDSFAEFKQWLREHKMYATDNYKLLGMSQNYAAETLSYELEIVKEYGYEELCAALSEWAKTAKPEEEWIYYFPAGKFYEEDFDAIYVDKMKSFGVCAPVVSVGEELAHITYVKSYKVEELDAVFARAEKWYASEEKDDPHTFYIRIDDGRDEEAAFMRELELEEIFKEWAGEKAGIKVQRGCYYEENQYYYAIIKISEEDDF